MYQILTAMKAYCVYKYGNPEEVMVLEDLGIPVPQKDEILIKVKTAAVNDYDWSLVTGNPKEYRLIFGLFKPRKKLRTLGMEVAGVVEKTGPEVTQFKPGDEVYGDTSDHGFGSFAEYMSVSEKAVVPKPEFLSFEEAVTLPHASMLALQGLYKPGELKKNQKLCINGGGGGVGALALQLAKERNCEVTGVDTGDKLTKMKTQGFDQVIDYKTTAFVDQGDKYDLILDCRTQLSPWRYLPALTKGGVYVSIGGRSGKLIQLLLLKPLIKLFTGKSFHMLSLKANSQLPAIEKLYKEGKLTSVIDGPYPFEQAPKAVQRFGDALHCGKVVVRIDA